MSDPVLHIKDSYYFEVPKFLAPARYTDKDQFPNVWVKNDPQFQEWEAERLYHGLQEKFSGAKLPDEHDLIHEWQHWQHAGKNHANFGKPLDAYLESFASQLRSDYDSRYGKLSESERPAYSKFLDEQEAAGAEGVWFARLIQTDEGARTWAEVKEHAGGNEAIEQFKDVDTIKWSPTKIEKYNEHLSGKILLDAQPFGELKNLYEPEPGGFAISKLMVIEIFVALIMFIVFGWVASRMRSGFVPRGRLWNILEVFLLFIRDQIARPAIGASHDDQGDGHGHDHSPQAVRDEHGMGGAGLGGVPVDVSNIHDDHPKHAGHAKYGKDKHHSAYHNPYADADRFVPLLWTIFFFVLGCNLFGLIPWFGSPTAAWGATLALALVTFGAVVIGGMAKFGFLGFFANQVPGMDLPPILAVFLKPMIFVIEIMGLLIKHLVLSIRLLANMVAGHLVILGLMGLAFGVQAALNFDGPHAAAPSWLWWPVALVTIVSATLFNILELFVAFLQAYVFTFLSALFIGAAVHKH